MARWLGPSRPRNRWDGAPSAVLSCSPGIYNERLSTRPHNSVDRAGTDDGIRDNLGLLQFFNHAVSEHASGCRAAFISCPPDCRFEDFENPSRHSGDGTGGGAGGGRKPGSGPDHGPASPYGGTVVEDIIARVNDQIITQSDYERAMNELNQEGQQHGETMQQMSDQRRDLLRNLIDQQLWLSKGKELGDHRRNGADQTPR